MWKACLFASIIKYIFFFFPLFLPWIFEGGRRHGHVLLWNAERAGAQHSWQSHVGLCLHCPSPGIAGGNPRGELQLALPPPACHTPHTHGHGNQQWLGGAVRSTRGFGMQGWAGTWGFVEIVVIKCLICLLSQLQHPLLLVGQHFFVTSWKSEMPWGNNDSSPGRTEGRDSGIKHRESWIPLQLGIIISPVPSWFRKMFKSLLVLSCFYKLLLIVEHFLCKS